MPRKFKVIYSSMQHFTIEVEAENEEQANKMAADADGSEFVEVCHGDWVHSNTYEIVDGKLVHPR